jgi:hypothetical protein
MTSKSGWEKPTSGPDWTDVEMLLRSIGGVHSADVAVIVTPSGTGATGGLEVVASALFHTLPGSALPPAVQVMRGWPCSSHRVLAAHSFALLHELDFAISEVYKQEGLWK